MMSIQSTLVDFAFLLWVLTELVGAILVPRLRRGPERVRQSSSSGSGGLIVLGILGAVGGLRLMDAAGWATLPGAYVELGVLLMVIGIGLRQWAIAVLGRFFNVTVRVIEDHRIVEAGPYRFVRHPSYTGAIVTLLGAGLTSGAWQGVLLMLGVAAITFGYRIRIEERLLLDQLGPEYAAYRARTKRLVPFLL